MSAKENQKAGDALKWLLATDGSTEAAAALEFVHHLPLPAGSAVHVISVVQPQAIPVHAVHVPTLEKIQEYEQQQAREAIADAEQRLQREGLVVSTAVPMGNAAAEIIRAADDFDADLIVVGSQGLTGLEGFLVGSVARNVARHARRPVLVGRAPQNDVQQIVVATDGSEQAAAAVRWAAKLPLPKTAQVTVVHVLRPPWAYTRFMPVDESIQQVVGDLQEKSVKYGRNLTAAAAEQLAVQGRATQTEVREGDPATEILRLAEECRADLIIAGARGASLIQGLFVGSVADRLLQQARCSLLIVH
jgi:nucleotide-binding universal stress UspA family protein